METSATPIGHSYSVTDFFETHPGARSISPLSRGLRDGLIAISVFSLLSFILSLALWSYLTYKLISWRIRRRSRARLVAGNMPEPPELDFYVGGRGRPGRSARMIYERNIRQIRSVEHESPNQFLILIYNLFLADIHKAAAFLIGSVWLSKDGIFIDTPACFIQGFFISIGGMASCCFITFIAIHAYMSVVESYQPPQRVFYIVIACVWMVVYLLPSLSILGTMNGKDVGGLYTRAGAWVSLRTLRTISPSILEIQDLFFKYN